MLFEDALKEARDIAFREGKEEGLQEGREELKKEIILRMSQEGDEIDVIARAVGLSPDKVRKIIEDE